MATDPYDIGSRDERKAALVFFDVHVPDKRGQGVETPLTQTAMGRVVEWEREECWEANQQTPRGTVE